MMLLRTTAFICCILYHATLAASVPSGYAKSFFLFSANGFDRPTHKPIWYNIRPMTTYIIGCLALIIKPGPDLMCTIEPTEPTGSDLIATVNCHSRFSLS